MKITFISNYINHHQIPLCEALRREIGEGFTFIQTEQMDEERVRMGWNSGASDLSWVVLMYQEPERAARLLEESDIVMAGWAPAAEEMIIKRLEAGRPVIRISERLYREGRWKAISPRGLVSKYKSFTRFRKSPCYLLCSGAYVASDFQLVHAFPGKMLRWGYFPPLRTYGEGGPLALKTGAVLQTGEMGSAKADEVSAAKVGRNGSANAGYIAEITWAGRFMNVKHPDMPLKLAAYLKENGCVFHLNMIGAGDKEEEYHRFVKDNGLENEVTFHGFLKPEAVRVVMDRTDIYLFTSDHGEGWGAVLNEAMNSGCCVVAGAEAGGVPALITNGVNGMIYNGTDQADFNAKVRYLIENPAARRKMAEAAVQTILTDWNGETAAARLLVFCRHIAAGEDPCRDLAASGPLSADPGLKPFLKVPTLEQMKASGEV